MTKNYTKGAILFTGMAIFYSFYLVIGRFTEGHNPIWAANWPFYLDNLMPGLTALYGFCTAPDTAGLTELLPGCRKFAGRAFVALLILGWVTSPINPVFGRNLRSIAAMAAFFMWLGCSLLLFMARRRKTKCARKGRYPKYSIRL